MTTIQPKLQNQMYELKKCIGITQRGYPCNYYRTMVRNCDNKGVCKKHLAQIPEFSLNINELPKNVFKLLHSRFFEKIPRKKCKILSPVKRVIALGISKDGWECRSCGTFYKDA